MNRQSSHTKKGFTDVKINEAVRITIPRVSKMRYVICNLLHRFAFHWVRFMFTNIRVLKLQSMSWKSCLNEISTGLRGRLPFFRDAQMFSRTTHYKHTHKVMFVPLYTIESECNETVNMPIVWRSWQHSSKCLIIVTTQKFDS